MSFLKNFFDAGSPTKSNKASMVPPGPPPEGYAFLPTNILLKMLSYLSETESLLGAFLTCKNWSVLSKQETTWKFLTTSRIKDVSAEDIASYKNSWLNLYVHLLNSEYYYLPQMYSHIYFIRKRKQAYLSSRSVIVLFPNGGIIQYILPVKSTVGQIMEHITTSLGLEHLIGIYNLQKKDGDFARAQWLSKDKNLDEIGIEERHILRFQQQLFFSGQQFDYSHVELLYPQIRDYILSGYYMCSREEAIIFAAIQMCATHGKLAESKMQSIVRSTLSSRLHNDNEIGLEILTTYQTYIEKKTFPNKNAAKLLYIQSAQKLKHFGNTIINLNNTALTCGIGFDDMCIMKTGTGTILDQWKLEHIENFEVKDNKITFKFGKNNKVIEMTPKPHEVAETSEILLKHLNFLADLRFGKIGFPLDIPITYGLTQKRQITDRVNTCDPVDNLIRSIQKTLKLSRDPQWGLVTTRGGQWLIGSKSLGFYNPSLLASGLEYRPYRSPTLIQLADGSVFLAYLNYSVPVSEVIEEIGQIIGITSTGLGLGLGSNLLSYYSSLSQQGIYPSGDQLLNCIHCMLPNHDLSNEISLDLGYSRAKHIVHNFNLPFLSPLDRRELNELEQRIESTTERPIGRLPNIARYLNLISKEVIFSVTVKEITYQLIVTEEQIRLKDHEGTITSSWPLSSLKTFHALDNGIELHFEPASAESFYKTSESYDIHRCITTAIDMAVFKQDRSRQKKKMLPIHDPDHETTIREGHILVDQIHNKLKAKQIEYLDLSWSAIRGAELQRICTLLKLDECVRHINMSGYGYGTNEILNLLSSIKNSKMVESLNLSYCGIDDQAANFIGEFLQTNKSIRTLNLTLNPYTKVGFHSILNGLKANGVLKQLHLQIPDLDILPELSYFLDRQYSLR